MPKVLTADKKASIKKLIFEKADAFGYASSARNDSGRFMDELVEDPDVGGVLKEYLTKERIRTYIKDGVLNAYTKELTKKVLAAALPSDTVQQIFGTQADVIQRCKGKDGCLSVLRSKDGRLFVISGGTVLKWETALRKSLEIIARQPGLSANGIPPHICLHLAVVNQDLTDGDKHLITTALAAIAVNVRFCGG